MRGKDQTSRLEIATISLWSSTFLASVFFFNSWYRFAHFSSHSRSWVVNFDPIASVRDLVSSSYLAVVEDIVAGFVVLGAVDGLGNDNAKFRRSAPPSKVRPLA